MTPASPVPHVERHDPPLVAPEREMLEAWLEYHRATLLRKCSGLTEEQLKQRSVPPSSLSLLGLVRHMTEVERGWFRRVLETEEVPRLYCFDGNEDGDFDDVDDADVSADLARFRDELASCRLVAARVTDLDSPARPTHPRPQASLRWIYLHMIEEYARHNGHADLLRERIDGATGE